MGFLSRWLLASWLPPILLCVLAMGLTATAGFDSVFLLYGWVTTVVPPLFWLFVAIGQSWAVRGHCTRPLQWGVVTFFAGYVAMLCFAAGSGMFLDAEAGPYGLFALLAILLAGVDVPRPITFVLSGAMFGFVIGAAQVGLLRWKWRTWLAWVFCSAAAGIAAFGGLERLYWVLYSTLVLELGIDLPSIVRFSLMLIGPGMAVFLLGWLVFALLNGLGLKFALMRQLRRDQIRIAASFD